MKLNSYLFSTFAMITSVRALHHRSILNFRASNIVNRIPHLQQLRMVQSEKNDIASTNQNRIKIKKIFDSNAEGILGENISIKGWVRTVRDQKKFSFIEINDGSTITGIQVVAQSSIPSYEEVSKLSTGAAVEITGTLVESIGKGQKYEIQSNEVKCLGVCSNDYPLQKKRHTQEFLRTIAHLRPRTNTISAAARVRSALSYATHEYFHSEGFVYLQSPIITASDCEGAGELFRVTTLPIHHPHKLPTINNNNNNNSSNSDRSSDSSDSDDNDDGNLTDFSQDFFGKPAYLTVSGQLSAEAYACALGDVYTFGPTFRAENSQTTRHLAEFNMIEPEMAFADMWEAMTNAENFIKYIIKYTLKTCEADLLFFQKFFDKTLIDRLQSLIDPNKSFARISYRDAIKLLQEEIEKDPSKWQFPDVSFGTDLSTEHERWLAEVKFKSCVFVHNYPKNIKAFYMRDNDDGETVDAFDLLVPGVGEMVGGSQREERLDILKKKLADGGLKEEDYWWYLDLRKFGSVPHSGYGLGFERLVCYVTGIENIREAVAFPRYPGSAEF